MRRNYQKTYGIILGVLLALFCFRVCAQFLQLIYPVSFLPGFQDWHSGALPYSALVGFQLVILIACVKVIVGFLNGKAIPSFLKGKILVVLGAIYFLVMIGRLTIGLIYPDAHGWFLVKTPTIFHLVLASFLLVLGHYHLKFSKAQP